MDFYHLLKIMAKIQLKVAKSMRNKYSQKLLDSAEKYTTDAMKTASKSAIQKTAEATGDLIGNEIADNNIAKMIQMIT